jgi:hypothetical protein
VHWGFQFPVLFGQDDFGLSTRYIRFEYDGTHGYDGYEKHSILGFHWGKKIRWIKWFQFCKKNKDGK